jgi:hypothetical protein
MVSVQGFDRLRKCPVDLFMAPLGWSLPITASDEKFYDPLNTVLVFFSEAIEC